MVDEMTLIKTHDSLELASSLHRNAVDRISLILDERA
jgi:hypothetical protein